MKEYQFRPLKESEFREHVMQHPVTVDVVGEALEKICLRNHGFLSPADVIEESRSADSPLHPYFAWDDKAAAGHYRYIQAQQMIRRVFVSTTWMARFAAPGKETDH